MVRTRAGRDLQARSFPGLSPPVYATSMPFMAMEFLRLFVGLAIAFFHRPIADYVIEQERSLVLMARQRGLPLPAAPSTESGRTIYFSIGMFVVLFELARIYLALHGYITL